MNAGGNSDIDNTNIYNISGMYRYCARVMYDRSDILLTLISVGSRKTCGDATSTPCSSSKGYDIAGVIVNMVSSGFETHLSNILSRP